MKKKFMSVVLCFVLIGSTCSVSACAAGTLKSFSDVPSTYWGYAAIMDMVSRGMFQGTTSPDANGVGTFEPDATMSQAQFITVVTRYLYADELAARGASDPWYLNSYQTAEEKGLIRTSEFNLSSMNDGMKREEMAIVLVRAMQAMGEDTTSTIQNSDIPDYNSIGTACRSYVKIAYSKGLIAGVDSIGTFNPKGTLTRAEAATVIYRLVEPSTRVEVKTISGGSNTNIGIVIGTVPATGATWVEGQPHAQPKVGDTVIKADGTKVVIQRGIGGVLGAGQGVDIWSGYKNLGSIDMNYYNGVDSGKDMTVIKKDSITGETHTDAEWQSIMGATDPTNKQVGAYDGEWANTWWQWNTKANAWVWMGP